MDYTALGWVIAVGAGVYGATHIAWAKKEIAAVEAAAKKDVAEIRGWFKHSTVPTTVVSGPASTGGSVSEPVKTVTSTPTPTTTTAPFVKTPAEIAGEARITAWLAPAIDWTKVSATDLTTLYKQQISSAGVDTDLDPATGLITTIPKTGIPSPNFEIQSRVWRGLSTTETERAFVGYNNNSTDGIGAHFITSFDGTTTAR